MNGYQEVDQERSVLRWGGLAGILGGILFILTWVVIIVGPVGMEDPADLAGWVTRFPDIQMARVLENGIYLVAAMLGVLKAGRAHEQNEVEMERIRQVLGTGRI